ncbi:DUF2326 domain-containing protein, partial [Helicobacter sp. 13S00482-2]|uniref:DUF2326 domain-containing protein n=1 Tax=Helicobacter sp. 13S00482-2 TaxID=1476200 RepID=UPI00117BAE37
NEANYLKDKIKELEIKMLELGKNRDYLSTQYSQILEKLSKTGSLTEYTKLNQQIEKLAEEKGQNEKMLIELGQIEKEIEYTKKNLLELNKKMNEELEDFENKLAIFNESFTNYSKLLYETGFILSYEYTKKKEPIKFYCKNAKGNEGSGKKQAIISAFDLAYIDFINKLNLNFPHFVAHDKVELIDINKLE